MAFTKTNIFKKISQECFILVAWFDFTRFFGEISFQCTVYNCGIFLKKVRQMPLYGNYQVQYFLSYFHKTHMNLPIISLKYIFGEMKKSISLRNTVYNGVRFFKKSAKCHCMAIFSYLILAKTHTNHSLCCLVRI